MSKILKNILLVILVLAVVSNAYVHINEIMETKLNTARIQINSAVIFLSNQLTTDILERHLSMIVGLYSRVLKLEKRESIIIDKVEKQVPDFEKLMNGTVTIYNKGYVVAGVCIYEDENYYYILTVQHLLQDRDTDIRFPKNAVPESNMGLATKLEAIILFINEDDLKELVPKEEIINTTVQSRDYVSVAGEFIYICPLFDLGLLRVYKASGIKLEVVKIAETFPKLGDEIYILGHPLGRKYNLSKGIVSNLDRPFVMGVDALMTFGNSGGGVFNTKGEIIGICSRVPAYMIETGEESTIIMPDKLNKEE